jgi:hypothetical protein
MGTGCCEQAGSRPPIVKDSAAIQIKLRLNEYLLFYKLKNPRCHPAAGVDITIYLPPFTAKASIAWLAF